MLTDSGRDQPGQIAVIEDDRAMTCQNVVEFPVDYDGTSGRERW
jgi:hypothetical protein